MDASSRDALSAVVRRHRGRARLRTATIAAGTAGLVAAGVLAASLPGTGTQATTSTRAAPAAGGHGTTSVVHVTSGGSAVTTTTSGGTTGTSAPAPAAGTAHATSGSS